MLTPMMRLLCFDEMQVTDVADAMILRRLFGILLDLGVTVIITSNRPPEGLYEGGLNRSLFLPFIDAINERLDVVGMGATHDYRIDRAVEADADAAGFSLTSGRDSVPSNAPLPSYVCPSPDDAHLPILEEWFARGGGPTHKATVPVAMGRKIEVSRANDGCAWFDFDDLCRRPLGAADYLAVAEHWESVIVVGVPRLGADSIDEARRFVTLIDALYEARTKLVVSAAVPRDELFVGFEAELETQDGDEEFIANGSITDVEGEGRWIREDAIQNRRGDEESLVIGEGGSSSSQSTTMIRTKDGDMEWSATGRVGVSLAQLSAVKEVSFLFQRAKSRLAEMSSAKWGRTSIQSV